MNPRVRLKSDHRSPSPSIPIYHGIRMAITRPVEDSAFHVIQGKGHTLECC